MSLPSSVRSVDRRRPGSRSAARTSALVQQRPQLAAQDHEQLGDASTSVELELEPAGLDLGDVEQVADEPQLVLRRRAG